MGALISQWKPVLDVPQGSGLITGEQVWIHFKQEIIYCTTFKVPNMKDCVCVIDFFISDGVITIIFTPRLAQKWQEVC